MFHLELFKSSISSGANTFGQVNYYTTDNVLPQQVNGLQVPVNLPFLHSIMGVGAHMVHVRAQANSMTPFPYPALSPNNRGAAFESPPRIWDFSSYPIPLRPTEELDIFATQNSGGSETQYVAVQVCDGPVQPYSAIVNPSSVTGFGPQVGRYFSVHWTASTTLTAGAWTQVAPSFDQTLPAGQYALLGARVYSATGLFFRMFPATAPLWRPGGIAVQAYDQMDPVNQRFIPDYATTARGWGVWLSFYQNVPPQVEILSTSADTAEEGWFDLVFINPAFTGGAI